jgi:hypothetical protein
MKTFYNHFLRAGAYLPNFKRPRDLLFKVNLTIKVVVQLLLKGLFLWKVYKCQRNDGILSTSCKRITIIFCAGALSQDYTMF